MAASSTIVPLLSGRGEEELVFTWPQPFQSEVLKVDVVPKVPFEK